MERKSGQRNMSRRDALTLFGVLAIGTVAYRRELSREGGKLIDTLLSPEDIIHKPISVLIPRENDTPLVVPKKGNATYRNLQTNYTREGNSVSLQIDPLASLSAEHSGIAISEKKFMEAGAAVLTSAEGLVHGKQEYCTLFRGREQPDQLLAVGFENGVYAYDRKLKEWVKVVTEDSTGQTYLSTSWDKYEQQKPKRMLMEETAMGIDTLLSVDYRPWAAVLPSTKIPGSMPRKTSIEAYAQNKEDIMAKRVKTEMFYLTENGDLIDVHHLWAKTGETLDLFGQLHEQALNKISAPIAKVAYSPGHSAQYQFAVDRASLQPETILDTTFQLMAEVGYRMEGVSQRLLIEEMPVTKSLVQASGMMPEDLFSNSLGILSMIALLREKDLINNMQNATTIRADIELMKSTLMHEAVSRVVQKYGVRSVHNLPSENLPAGLYPLIPTKVTDNEKPTHIDLEGVRPNNPIVHYSVTHVPALEINLQRGVTELEKIITPWND